MMNKGFTLLELIVVIIIVGILASVGLTQYTRVIEKSRTAEAKANLGTLRAQQLAYYEEKGVYSSVTDLATGLPTAAPACASTEPANSFYFGYACATDTGTCTATRCTANGKAPVGPAYSVTLSRNGIWGGTSGYY